MVTKNESGQISEMAVASLNDIPVGGMLRVTVDKIPMLLCRLQEQVFAVGAICPHRGAPLERGLLKGALLRCPWHGIQFDVRTGARVCVPECADLKVYQVTVRDEQVFVSFPACKEE